MPILHLHVGVPQSCCQFAAVGLYDTPPPFVRHVALLSETTTLQHGMQNVLVWHMGPPLITGARTSAGRVRERLRRMTVHIAGYVELTPDEVEGIVTWLADVDQEDRPLDLSPETRQAQYIVAPHVRWHTAENGMPLYRRFSCVGYVIECYRSVQINLIDDSLPGNLPEVSLDIIIEAYGQDATDEERRTTIGIPGPGPWRIILAGYVFHSLNRPSEAIRQTPHLPSGVAERNFP